MSFKLAGLSVTSLYLILGVFKLSQGADDEKATLLANITSFAESNDLKTVILETELGYYLNEIGNSWSVGIESWETVTRNESKEELFKDHPWYVAGYDFEKRPVVVWELGRSKVRKYVDAGEAEKERLMKYSEWKWYKISQIKSPFAEAEDGIFLIVDTDKYDISELASFEAVRANLHAVRIIERLEAHFSKVVFINVNFVGQTWLNICKPVAGRWVGKADVFGTQKEKWIPFLQQYIPKNQLPPFYGGNSGTEYTAIEVYG